MGVFQDIAWVVSTLLLCAMAVLASFAFTGGEQAGYPDLPPPAPPVRPSGRSILIAVVAAAVVAALSAAAFASGAGAH